MFPRDRFDLSGPVAEYSYIADNGNQVTRVFCPICGSPILGRNSASRDYLTITLGTVDDSSGFEPRVVVFTCNKMPWDILDDQLMAFETQPDWKPENGARLKQPQSLERRYTVF